MLPGPVQIILTVAGAAFVGESVIVAAACFALAVVLEAARMVAGGTDDAR